jgi:hypothetical protein
MINKPVSRTPCVCVTNAQQEVICIPTASMHRRVSRVSFKQVEKMLRLAFYRPRTSVRVHGVETVGIYTATTRIEIAFAFEKQPKLRRIIYFPFLEAS